MQDDVVLRWSTGFWDMNGNEGPGLRRYVNPFLEAVVSESLVPSREEVLSQVRIAVQAPSPSSDVGEALDYEAYAPIFRRSIGLPGYVSIAEATAADPEAEFCELTPYTCRRELPRDQVRYYRVPTIPQGVAAPEGAIETILLAELATASGVQERLDAAHPAVSSGDAWVVQVGGRIYANNGQENSDQAQSLIAPVEGWACSAESCSRTPILWVGWRRSASSFLRTLRGNTHIPMTARRV